PDQKRQRGQLASDFATIIPPELIERIHGRLVVMGDMGDLCPVTRQKRPRILLVAGQFGQFELTELAKVHLRHGRQAGWPALGRYVAHQSSSPITVPTS